MEMEKKPEWEQELDLEMEAKPVINLSVDWADKEEARSNAVAALTGLLPVFNLWASFAPEDAYAYNADADSETDRLNNQYWASLRSAPEYGEVKEALAEYLRYIFASPRIAGVADFIVNHTPSMEKLDLYADSAEYVFARLPAIFRNVNNSFLSKKGTVAKGEGCLLYISQTIFNRLVDRARKICSRYGRNAQKCADLYETEGCPLHSAEELTMGATVIRKGNRVGTYTGESFSGGTRFAVFQFDDGCVEQVPWSVVCARIRLFTGNRQDIPLQEEEEKLGGTHNLSLDEIIGTDGGDDGFTLLNLLPGAKSCEESLLENEMCGIVRRTYLDTMHTLRKDFLKSYMLAVYVHEKLCLDITHTDEVIRQLSTRDHLSLFRDLHERNCAIMSMAPEAEGMTPGCDAADTGYTVKQITAAKHYAKCLLRTNMEMAMAA